MKKVLILTLLVLVITTSIFALAGCHKRDITELILIEDENFAVYDEANVAQESGAHDLIVEAYDNWIANKNYTRQERFSFKAFNGAIDFATRETELTRKIVDDKIY